MFVCNNGQISICWGSGFFLFTAEVFSCSAGAVRGRVLSSSLPVYPLTPGSVRCAASGWRRGWFWINCEVVLLTVQHEELSLMLMQSWFYLWRRFKMQRACKIWKTVCHFSQALKWHAWILALTWFLWLWKELMDSQLFGKHPGYSEDAGLYSRTVPPSLSQCCTYR